MFKPMQGSVATRIFFLASLDSKRQPVDSLADKSQRAGHSGMSEKVGAGPMRVLFLPFDGVLHPAPVSFSKTGRPELPTDLQAHRFFENLPLLVVLLQGHPDVRIVLSTRWVDTYSLSWCLRKLPRDICSRVVGTTSGIRTGSDVLLPLADQVRQYAAKHSVYEWVVLTHERSQFPASEEAHVVPTDPVAGLGCHEAEEALTAWLLATASQAGPQKANTLKRAGDGAKSPDQCSW